MQNLILIASLFSAQIFGQASGTGRGAFESGVDGYGACSYPAGAYQYYAGVDSSTFANSAMCGACLEVTNTDNNKSVIVNVADICSGCGPNDLNINSNAFQMIGDPASGSVPISWKQIRCPNTNGNIQYRWQAGSNEWWAGLQIMNSAQAIKSIEVNVNNEWKHASRNNNNIWILNGATNPANIRTTGVDGKVVQDSVQILGDGGNVPSNGQL